MRLSPVVISEWPKLAWVAVASKGSDVVEVYHGPRVETAAEWVVEAVWAGEFATGDFDKTDILAGTGVRLRGCRVVFVNSGSAVDRLWYWNSEGRWHVSNSLPAILACTNVSLDNDYTRYPQDIETIDEYSGGLSSYRRQLRTTGTPLSVVYFHNLVFDGRDLHETPKPDTAPALTCYADYFFFLKTSAQRMGENARATDRRWPVVPTTTVSSGYDSSAVAVIAQHAGCTRSLTIDNPTSFWRGSDSGRDIAEHLGMACDVYRHVQGAYRGEEHIWAAVGRPKGLNMTVFEYPQPLSLLFTGNYGDKIWDLSYKDVSEPTGDLSGLCLCEFRLAEGFFHSMPAWWAVRHSRDIQKINRSQEMAPWTMHDDYDRPIARRLIEEAGIPRGTFAVRKKDTSSDAAFWWPYSRQSMAGFRRYVQRRGNYAPGPLAASAIRRVAFWENLFHKNITRKLGIRWRWRPWHAMAARSLLFQWANDVLKTRYRTAWQEAVADAERGESSHGEGDR